MRFSRFNNILMKNRINIYFVILISLAVAGCNTLYNYRMAPIEIMEPGKFYFSDDSRKIAVRYNNSNVSYNPEFATYFEGETIKNDTSNIDSIASEIYFHSFFETLTNLHFFDTILEIKPGNYSNVVFSAYIMPTDSSLTDSTRLNIEQQNNATTHLYQLLSSCPGRITTETSGKELDPQFGLYSKNELKEIADTTGADILISLDFFTSVDGTTAMIEFMQGFSSVYNLFLWNIYDLKRTEPHSYYSRVDTVSWSTYGNSAREIRNLLPPRKDAVLNAADISGAKFAEVLVPHWTKTERLYYYSGHQELKKTDAMIQSGNWMEAAKIWKANINNPNKSVAAKSMFNLGIACEIAGDLDAAIDWVVKSFYVFGNENEIHSINCTDYLSILGQRGLDIKKIKIQMNPGIPGVIQQKKE